MIKTQDRIDQRISLRAEAESMVARFYPKDDLSATAEKLMHELIVHKIELELHNEEMRATHASMAQMLDHYRDLYNYAPVGYLTISREGLITQANLTGCALLSIEPGKVINQPFASFIASHDSDRWYRLALSVFENAANQNYHDQMELIDKHGVIFSVDLIYFLRKPANDMPEIRVSFTAKKNIQRNSYG